MITTPVTRPPADPPAAARHVVTRPAVFGWVTYDLANTIFTMGVVSLYFPIWVRDAVGAQRADTMYGIISAVSMAIIFVLAPVLGAMTDRARRRMPFLIASTVLCVGFTLLLARAGFWWTALFFVVANVAYQAGLQFYDALLPEVSTEENRGRISGIGVGVGYMGSYLAIGIGLLFGTDDKPLLFSIIAVSFLVLALPCFLFVRERGNPDAQPFGLGMIRDAARGTIQTFRNTERYPGLLRFLVGRVFYTDAINTVIAIMALYVVNIAVASGLGEAEGERQAQLILMSAITFAVLGGFAWGWLADRWGPKRTLNLVLYLWMGVFTAAALVGLLDLPLPTMYGVAAGAGIALGGIWAADRPYMLRLTPPGRVGEFYGLYGMVGRFSAITGPALWALITWATIQRVGLEPQVGQALGVFVLLGMILLSYWILRPVTDERRAWEGDDLAREDRT